MAVKRIGILTGGGDCPGLNPTIKGVVTRAADHGIEVLGLQNGWKSLVSDEPIYAPLSVDDVRPIIKQGGTILHTSRTNAYNKNNPEYLPNLVKNVEKLGLDAIVAIGGDDTLSVASRLTKGDNLSKPVPCVGVPKTMDNDVHGTDQCFGFDTSVTLAVEAIQRLRDTADSHNRVIVLEVFGRKAGWTALYTAIAADADYVLIPERNPADLAGMMKKLQEVKKRRNYALVVVAEGADHPDLDVWANEIAKGLNGTRLGEASVEIDSFGHPILKERRVGDWAAWHIKNDLGWDTRVSVMAHLMRGGEPTLVDRILGARLGVAAADYVAQGKFGVMAALKGQDIVPFPLEELTDNNGKSITRNIPSEYIEFGDIIMK
ncbi:MAG: ATP-dependent phosphofructokinase / diphosphate-dependent phosphofructokinase [Abditibacteriota bacterium]|nr:ATP-dependent phosphofructokinase / diphosphate-dependent phosphofructokinase [Abditibacteriota bacterium]